MATERRHGKGHHKVASKYLASNVACRKSMEPRRGGGDADGGRNE